MVPLDAVWRGTRTSGPSIISQPVGRTDGKLRPSEARPGPGPSTRPLGVVRVVQVRTLVPELNSAQRNTMAPIPGTQHRREGLRCNPSWASEVGGSLAHDDDDDEDDDADDA